MIKVKNILNRTTAKVMKRQIKTYVQGSFLKVGDKKIPIGKTAEVDDRFADQVRHLQSLGVIEIIGNMPSTTLTPKVISSVQRTLEVSRNKKLEVESKGYPLGEDTATLEFDDFIIITNSKNIDSLPGFKDTNKIIPLEVEKEIVEEIKEEPILPEVVKEEEVVEEVQRDCPRRKRLLTKTECEVTQKKATKKCANCEFLSK